MSITHTMIIDAMRKANLTNTMIDVSNIMNDASFKFISHASRVKHSIKGLQIVSDNFPAYAYIVHILGPEWEAFYTKMYYDIYEDQIALPWNIRFLNGPESLTVYRDTVITGRVVYIFSDIHGRDYSCPNPDAYPIQDVLTHIFNTSTVPIDFFLENTLLYIDEKYGANKNNKASYLNQTKYSQITKYIHMPMVRSHYIDPRADNLYMAPINIFDIIFTSQLKNSGIAPKSTIDVFFSRDLSTIELYRNYVLEIFFNTQTYIGKELDRSILKDDIIAFFMVKLDLAYYKFYHKLEAVYKRYALDELEEHDFQIINDCVVGLNSSYMDVYCVSRMFKIFKGVSRYKSELFTELPMNMILYTGSNHATRISEFLQLQGFECTEQAQSYIEDNMCYIRCLDIGNIVQPLFSAYV